MESNKDWRGEATYFDGESAQANKVEVAITRTGISIIRDGAAQNYAPSDFQVTEKLENYIRLSLERHGGVLVLEGKEAVAALHKHQLIKRGWFAKLPLKTRYVSIIAVLAALLVFFFTHGLDLLVENGVDLIPPSLEESLGENVFEQLTIHETMVSDSQTVAILQKCAHLVQAFDTTQAYNFKIHIVENELVNAYALPGGTIVFFRGLLNTMDDQGEFFGVLAHEAGHIYLRHGLKRIARTVLLGFVVSVMLGDASGLSSAILDNSALLLNLAYGREEELAADKYAAATLRKININPSGLMTLFGKMDDSKGDWKVPAYLSTHPVTERRIEILRDWVPMDLNSQLVLSDEEWQTLKGQIISD